VLFTALCLWQGLMFLRLKTSGDLAARASRRAVPVSWAVVALLTAHITWTRFVVGSGVIPGPATWVALTLAVAAAWLATDGSHEAVAFGCSAATIAFVVFGFFGELHPNLMVSTTSIADNITVANSSSQYTLTLKTIVTGVMLPVVILYTAWNYWVFRQRVTVDVPDAPAEPEPSA
jgi:cytochrome d ubiquinol oxidase subunit II